MLNDKALIQVCLLVKETEKKIVVSLEEIKKDLTGVYPLSHTTCNEIDELKQLIEMLSRKLKEFSSTYAYEGFRVLSGQPPKIVEEVEEAPF